MVKMRDFCYLSQQFFSTQQFTTSLSSQHPFVALSEADNFSRNTFYILTRCRMGIFYFYNYSLSIPFIPKADNGVKPQLSVAVNKLNLQTPNWCYTGGHEYGNMPETKVVANLAPS